MCWTEINMKINRILLGLSSYLDYRRFYCRFDFIRAGISVGWIFQDEAHQKFIQIDFYSVFIDFFNLKIAILIQNLVNLQNWFLFFIDFLHFS